MTVLRKSFYIHWSAGRSPRVHEVNPGRDPSAGGVADATAAASTSKGSTGAGGGGADPVGGGVAEA